MEYVLVLLFWVDGLARNEVWGPYRDLAHCLDHAVVIVEQRIDPSWPYQSQCVRINDGE